MDTAGPSSAESGRDGYEELTAIGGNGFGSAIPSQLGHEQTNQCAPWLRRGNRTSASSICNSPRSQTGAR